LTNLYAYLFTYPKPIVAALNGHAIAGGCMLALASDYRIMVSGKAREVARRLAAKDAAAFRSIKDLLRAPVADEMAKRDEQSVREFVDIWYSENTWGAQS
jgi:enoyl-CoA hydratase/carnithine racemase